MADRIHLNGVSFLARIGTTEAERSEPQGLLLDLVIELELEAAANTDDLSLTVNYVDLVERIERTAGEREYQLLEALSGRICRAVLEDPRINAVEATLHKFPAVLKGKVTSVAVEMHRKAG